MKFHTEYLTFNTKKHREYIHITPQVEKDPQEQRGVQRHGAGFSNAHYRGSLRERQ